jgi:hypothetical protein
MRVGNSSVRNGPMPEKMPEAKKPRGKPSQSISVLSTGSCVYTITVTIEHSANRMKLARRPMRSLSQALTR